MIAGTDRLVLLAVDDFSRARPLDSRKIFRLADFAAQAPTEKLEESDFGAELERHALAVSFGTLKEPATARARASLACISQHPV